jgi:hypothetical protein
LVNRHRRVLQTYFGRAANVFVMARADVQQADVHAAIADYDQLGRERFLQKMEYKSKSTFAAPNGHRPGLLPLSHRQFSDGADGAVKCLRRLAFDVYCTRGT